MARAVNSKTTIGEGETEILKKIKAIETIDLIHYYAVTTADDEYRGQCANNYDNKCLLIAALRTFLQDLEPDVLAEGTSGADIDLEATRAYLIEEGVDVTDMSDDETAAPTPAATSLSPSTATFWTPWRTSTSD